jgi:predicted dehydrogenase
MAATILLIGCGNWGKLILRAETRVRALTVGAAAAFDSVTFAISRSPGIDGVIVATPTSTHGAVIRQVLELLPSAPVFTEKCLAPSAREAAELAVLGGNRLFVMDKWRYHPGIELLRDLVLSGEFGRVRSIRLVRRSENTKHVDVDPVWILLPHDLSITLELLGDIPRPQAARGISDGTWATEVSALLGDDPFVTIDISGRALTRDRSVTIQFEDAVVALADSDASSLQVVRRPVRAGDDELCVEELPFAARMPLRAELEVFLAYLRGEGPSPRSSAAEGAKIVENISIIRQLAGFMEIPYDQGHDSYSHP